MRGQRLLGIGLFVVAVSAALAAQTAQQRPTFRSGIDLIEVDASVIDGDGLPIADLQPSDFSVTVDGEPRRVLQAHFDLLRPERDAGRPTPVAEDVFYTSNTDATRGRLIVIAVDEESILFGEGRHVMRAAGEFVDSLSPGDRVSLVAVPQPGVYIDFTSNHDRVRDAVAGMSGLARRRVGTLNIGVWEAFQIIDHYNGPLLEQVIGRICPQRARSGARAFDDVGVADDPTAGALAGQAFNLFVCQQRVEDESRQIVQESRLRSQYMRYGLQDILRALREVEGPKVLLWISGGHVVDGTENTMRALEDLVVEARTTIYVMMVDEPLGGDITQAASSPSPADDRRMREEGLHMAASITRGTVFRAHFNPAPIFDRLEREMSGYYLLGVESRPNDRDKERRKIEVSVRREGARVRARREVTFAPEETDPSVAERLGRMLRSPVPHRDLPVRVATYAYQLPDSEQSEQQVRVVVAAELGVSPPLTMGFMLRDPVGNVVASGMKEIAPQLAGTPSGQLLETSFDITVEPGAYSLRVAALDAAGQGGSVEHPVHAEPMSDGHFSVGDLLVADQANGMRPPVEARVSSGRLLAFTELYADSSEVWQGVVVHLDVADDATGPPRAEGTTTIPGPGDPFRRAVLADLAVDHLPPGRYVVRARVMHDSIEVAQLHRPFRITAPYAPAIR